MNSDDRDAIECTSNSEEVHSHDDEKEEEKQQPHLKNYCYVLINDKDHKTYNGYTNNPLRRLRQHNSEIKGGAKFTTRRRKKDGPNPRTWEFLAIIESPGMTQKKALSLEWHIKYPTCRKPRPREYNGANGRLASLSLALGHKKFRGMFFTARIMDRYLDRARRVLLDSPISRQRLSSNEVNLDLRLLDDIDEDNLRPQVDPIFSSSHPREYNNMTTPTETLADDIAVISHNDEEKDDDGDTRATPRLLTLTLELCVAEENSAVDEKPIIRAYIRSLSP